MCGCWVKGNIIKFEYRLADAVKVLSQLKQASVILCLVVIASVLTACTSQPAQPPVSGKNVPVYPGATRPEVVDKSQAQDGSWLIITYSTAAAPSTVFGFYDDLLLSDNWLSLDVPDKAGSRRFTWSSENYGTMYFLSVDTDAGDGQTNVTVEFREQVKPTATPVPTTP